ncbi:DUF664 domain-containing protein [Pseudonocardia sp. S2-4]|uniref:DUF664 domain-containing protein n=1 Tax=Pseudonocardia humida TaxID=2800819 RepID=A0ABT1A5D3_9PSEU|nr:DinB family protein [Pseudonocardia humida]MCO1658208.1 DUF664 domain-containing protein [Pseudonocardia humida]
MTAVKDERAALLHFLAAQRRSAPAVLDGLSDADAGRSVVPSGWTPLAMADHLGGVERHWFGFVLGGDAEWTRAVPGEPQDLDEAVRAYRAEIERSDRLLAGFALDDPVTAVPDQPPGEIHTVRDVVLHVIEELARHRGHLDIARELLDDRTGLGPRKWPRANLRPRPLITRRAGGPSARSSPWRARRPAAGSGRARAARRGPRPAPAATAAARRPRPGRRSPRP